ncbi:MAG TPA: twin-arginine translocase subunit TatC [Actinomycetota bacterium]|nr:twin-arginine translocase subunit TatC [Actinomycetota bacterium]
MSSDLRSRRRIFRRRRKQKSAVASMSMMQHLGELRDRLIVAGLAFVVLSVVAFIFYEPILALFKRPLCEVPPDLLGAQGCELTFFKATGGFSFRLKLTALVGLAVASPIWMYEIYAFVTPALTSKEKRYTIPFLVTAVTLFAVGAVIAFFAMPTGLRFLLQIGGEGLNPLLGAEEYLNFVGFMLLGFAVAFELPLVLFFLGLSGAVTVDQLKKQRRVAIVAIAGLAAVVTPSQDPYTLLLLAVPLYVLYEGTIVLLRIVKRKKDKASA